MKPAYALLAAVAILSSAACDAKKGNDSIASSAPIKPVAPPKGGDWTKMVVETPEGGYLMGNPNADVKVVEYGSLTCPHCAEFAEKGAPNLINDYVKTGRVSYEFRNYLRDGLDMSLALIARCAEPDRFFPLIDTIYKNQKEIFERAQAHSEAEMQAAANRPGIGYAELAGLPQWAAQQGIPSSKSAQCLTNQAQMDKLIQGSTDATTQYPDFAGTPTFILNGSLLKQTATWDKLEPAIRDALGG